MFSKRPWIFTSPSEGNLLMIEGRLVWSRLTVFSTSCFWTSQTDLILQVQTDWSCSALQLCLSRFTPHLSDIKILLIQTDPLILEHKWGFFLIDKKRINNFYLKIHTNTDSQSVKVKKDIYDPETQFSFRFRVVLEHLERLRPPSVRPRTRTPAAPLGPDVYRLLVIIVLLKVVGFLRVNLCRFV